MGYINQIFAPSINQEFIIINKLSICRRIQEEIRSKFAGVLIYNKKIEHFVGALIYGKQTKHFAGTLIYTKQTKHFAGALIYNKQVRHTHL